MRQVSRLPRSTMGISGVGEDMLEDVIIPNVSRKIDLARVFSHKKTDVFHTSGTLITHFWLLKFMVPADRIPQAQHR